jgi:hypothetical protein
MTDSLQRDTANSNACLAFRISFGGKQSQKRGSRLSLLAANIEVWKSSLHLFAFRFFHAAYLLPAPDPRAKTTDS